MRLNSDFYLLCICSVGHIFQVCFDPVAFIGFLGCSLNKICVLEQKQSHPMGLYNHVQCYVLFACILPSVTSVHVIFFSQDILVTVWSIACVSDYSTSFSVPSRCWESRREHLVRSQLGFGVWPAGKKIIPSPVCLLATDESFFWMPYSVSATLFF